MWKVANLDPQYRANMVPLIFAQEWGHSSVIFAYKILKLCNFYWKIIKFWLMFLRKLTGMGVCAKMAHQIILRSGPLTHVSTKIDMYGSLYQKWPIKLYLIPVLLKDQLQPVLDQSLNFSKIQATATGPITRGLGPQPQSGCNQWSVQSGCQSFEKS